jgi:cell division inhibitor SepF
VDFSAGLVFGLRGSIERVTNKVFLLSPSYIEVIGDDKKVSETQASFFNQS